MGLASRIDAIPITWVYTKLFETDISYILNGVRRSLCSLVVMKEFHDCFGPDKHLVHGALVELTLFLEINLIFKRDVRLHHTVGNKHLDTSDRAAPGVVGC